MDHIRHPLDQIYSNNSLLFLEVMIPYVDPSLRLPLALLIKVQEMRLIIEAFRNPERSELFRTVPSNQSPEDILYSLAGAMGVSIPEEMKHLSDFTSMMNQMSMSPMSDSDASVTSSSSEGNVGNSVTDGSDSAESMSNTESFQASRDELLSAIREILNEKKET